MKDIVERLSAKSHFFCFDYQEEWRIFTWSDISTSEDHPLHTTSQNIDRATPQMPFYSGWIAARPYGNDPSSFRKYYCSCSLGFHYSSQTWHFYGNDQEEQELKELLSTPHHSTMLDSYLPFQSSMSRQEYIDTVNQIKKEIANGNVYQMNLSYRIGPFAIARPAALWNDLAEENPSRHAFFWKTPSEIIICNSPELFLHCRNGMVKSTPIKGTHPKIGHPHHHTNLWSSPKEEAELTMIVDMMRNDLGQICSTGSVFVEGRKIRRCGDLLHAEQTIIGRLQPHHDPKDMLTSCFPAASITGAPKKAAMELIRNLETVEREWYTGSLGFISDQTDISEWNVCIRCIIVKHNQGYVHVGAGIVHDSDPEIEWLETQAKAKAIEKSLLTCQNI